MIPPRSLLALALATIVAPAAPGGASFRAGVHVVGIDPPRYPVRVNAMFTERSADKTVDPLQAKALVLDDGADR